MPTKIPRPFIRAGLFTIDISGQYQRKYQPGNDLGQFQKIHNFLLAPKNPVKTCSLKRAKPAETKEAELCENPGADLTLSANVPEWH